MNNKIKETIRIGLAACALVVALTGCCLMGSKKCCNTCGKETCACCCRPAADCGKKTSGMNTSMTLGIGTDGIHAGTAANIGPHGVSGDIGGSMH